jgi:hypothetical protein
MNPSPLIICAACLSAMIAAGVSHFWSVQSFAAHFSTENPPAILQEASPEIQKPTPEPQDRPRVLELATAADKSNLSQEEFFNALLTELKQIKNENRDLRDLMGETNRDVMKLAFRVDTHSESFRPLPTTEESQDTTFRFSEDENPGVLPPRASPVRIIGE